MKCHVPRLFMLLALVAGCGANQNNTTGECLCAGDASVDAPDGAVCADEKKVLVYTKPGCGAAATAIECVDPADTACINIVCGCDGKVHWWPCEGPREPFQFIAGGNEGDPCGDAGVDASPD